MNINCLRVITCARYHFNSTISRKFYKNLHKMSGDQLTMNASNRGVRLDEAVTVLQQFADLRLAEKWDNVGLLIEPPTSPLIENVLLTNDLTENVMDEAIDKQINLIISYHPPIFKPLKRITKDNWKERIVGLCLENRIAVYSPHTSWDAVYGGVTDWLADAFSQHLRSEIQPLIPNIDQELYPRCGSGRLVHVNEIDIKSCIKLIKLHCGLNNLKVAFGNNKNLDSPVQSVALVCGSGGSLLQDARADLFVTGEMSHHELLEANHNEVTVILTNHSDSERGFLKKFCVKLEQLFQGNANVFVSQSDKDPLCTV